MLAITQFLSLFPEFTTRDTSEVASLISQATIESSGYSSLPTELQEMALALHTAHLIQIEISLSMPQSNGRVVKSYKSKHDEIEFFQESGTNPFDFSSTRYGMRLQRLLDCCYVGFQPEFDCGCSLS